MQTAPVSWMMDAWILRPSSAGLHVVSDARGGSMKRCQRCDIPLGSQRCPSPQCREAHGQPAGTLCVWCRDLQQARMERIDVAG